MSIENKNHKVVSTRRERLNIAAVTVTKDEKLFQN
jgi:hypothetical protein